MGSMQPHISSKVILYANLRDAGSEWLILNWADGDLG